MITITKDAVQAIASTLPVSVSYPDKWASPTCESAWVRVNAIDILNNLAGGTDLRFNITQAVEGVGEVAMPAWTIQTNLVTLSTDEDLAAWSQLAQLATYAIAAKLWERKAATL